MGLSATTSNCNNAADKLDWLAHHVHRLRASYLYWTARHLVDPTLDDKAAIDALDLACFAVVSHDTQAEPVFNYGNRAALQLFELSWEQFTQTPSRQSAEPMLQDERDRLLQQVARHGYVDDYRGVRISSRGKRFLLLDATVWNLLDEAGQPCGQAALLRRWRPLMSAPSG